MEPTFSLKEMLIKARIAERLHEAERHRVARRVRQNGEVKGWWHHVRRPYRALQVRMGKGVLREA